MRVVLRAGIGIALRQLRNNNEWQCVIEIVPVCTFRFVGPDHDDTVI